MLEASFKAKFLLDDFNYCRDDRIKPSAKNTSRVFLSPIGCRKRVDASISRTGIYNSDPLLSKIIHASGVGADYAKLAAYAPVAGLALQRAFIYASNVL